MAANLYADASRRSSRYRYTARPDASNPVAQTSGLPYRRFSTCAGAPILWVLQKQQVVSRLQVGDTADRRSALRALQVSSWRFRVLMRLPWHRQVCSLSQNCYTWTEQ